ncbi:VCBS repeat-containing protein [Maribacter sp. 2304DJ31-5]|uniref:VCBS repeat-containing protein n=1 Tax=Maribacter sp. 2304DJ31-5 TaxID=3386273 RepID=UPI0039BD6F86
MGLQNYWYFLLVFMICVGCDNSSKEKQNSAFSFELKTAKETNIDFENNVFPTADKNVFTHYTFYNGGGVAIVDLNNDELLDVCFVGNHVLSKIYINKGDFTFEDITAISKFEHKGWDTGITFADIEGDGDNDLYVSTVDGEPNRLYINSGINKDGIPIFEEKAESFGIAQQKYTNQSTFFDYDKDGDLDLFLLINSSTVGNKNRPDERMLNGESPTTDMLYQNNGNGTFSNVSKEAGILNEGLGLGLSVTDLNEDNWPDIYIANDFLSQDIIYINQNDGTFKDRSSQYLEHASYNGMGVDIADYNQDGHQDILVLDMLPETNERRKSMLMPINYDLFQLRQERGYLPQHVRNTLQLGMGKDANGSQVYQEIGCLANVYATDWSWAPLWTDLNNDGFLDLYVTNGYLKNVTDLDYALAAQHTVKFGNENEIRRKQVEGLDKIKGVHLPNYAFLNNQGAIALSDVTGSSGLDIPSFSNGAAYGDLDNDGDLDLVVNNLTEPAFVFENKTAPTKNNYLKIALQFEGGNQNGLGTKIKITTDKTSQNYYHSYTKGYLSSMNDEIHFGLGKDSIIKSLEVIWPNSKVNRWTNINANQLLKLRYQSNEVSENKPVQNQHLFQEVTNQVVLDYNHEENDHIDFNDSPLLLRMNSKNGPKMSKADVNGDGTEDIYITGSKGFSGRLFLQSHKGDFEEINFPSEIDREETNALFFDVDNDGDMDLYVACGGSDNRSAIPLYQDLLYLNDGKGNFSLDRNRLPVIEFSTATVIAEDYDRDGDEDLFVGCDYGYNLYPKSPQSYLLQNNNGHFSAVSSDMFENLGVIKDGIWTDLDNDGWMDLTLVGEWMPIEIFKNHNGKLQRTESNDLRSVMGLWNCIDQGDFDKDGDQDFVVGNLGLNNPYNVSAEHPLRVYIGDFDKNGKIDPIITYYGKDKAGNYDEYPLAFRDALIQQIVGFKRRFMTYESYGTAKMQQVFTKNELEGAILKSASHLSTMYFENLGNGKFKPIPLPLEAQVAPVNDFLIRDFDSDGTLDILLMGNNKAAEPVFGDYDAMKGLLLKGDGKNGFKAVPSDKSGLYIKGDAKSILPLKIKDKETYLVGRNNAPLMILKNRDANEK